MIAIDTNILIRFFINDDEKQSEQVNNLFAHQEEQENSIFISNIVLVELIWVLKSGYKVKKSDILKTLKLLFSNEIFKFEDRHLLLETIKKYEAESGDFADYLIGSIGSKYNASTTYTFDKRAVRDNNFTLLE